MASFEGAGNKRSWQEGRKEGSKSKARERGIDRQEKQHPHFHKRTVLKSEYTHTFQLYREDAGSGKFVCLFSIYYSSILPFLVIGPFP